MCSQLHSAEKVGPKNFVLLVAAVEKKEMGMGNYFIISML